MKLTHIILICFLVCCAWFGYIAFNPLWQYAHLERNARNVVTGSELQAWATNLLARDPEGTNLIKSNWGSDYPKQLDRLLPKNGPSVSVHDSGDTNFPSYVQVLWGSATMGHCGFAIGPTNFIGPGHSWQPGVYFFNL
jgi:hypothetical protein